jgi:hypothetical protein
MKYFLSIQAIRAATQSVNGFDFVSIAIVAENGREYYAYNDEAILEKRTGGCRNPQFRRSQLWVVHENLSSFPLPPKYIGINPSNPYISPTVKEEILRWKTRDRIREDILTFVSGFPSELWSYSSPLASVLLWELLKEAAIPATFPEYCQDIRQECDRVLAQKELELPPRQFKNSLEAAKWNLAVWNLLKAEQ